MAKTEKKAGKTAKENAFDFARKQKKTEVFENSKGEFFTDANAAALSDKKENITTHPVPGASKSESKSAKSSEPPAEKPLAKMNKVELTAAYLNATGEESVPKELDTNAKLIDAIEKAKEEI